MANQIGGASTPRFSSANNSASTAKSSDEKNSSEQYYYLEKDEEDENNEFQESGFVDKSAQLSASLDSMALLNVVNVLKNNKSAKIQKNIPQK